VILIHVLVLYFIV